MSQSFSSWQASSSSSSLVNNNENHVPTSHVLGKKPSATSAAGGLKTPKSHSSVHNHNNHKSKTTASKHKRRAFGDISNKKPGRHALNQNKSTGGVTPLVQKQLSLQNASSSISSSVVHKKKTGSSSSFATKSTKPSWVPLEEAPQQPPNLISKTTTTTTITSEEPTTTKPLPTTTKVRKQVNFQLPNLHDHDDHKSHDKDPNQTNPAPMHPPSESRVPASTHPRPTTTTTTVSLHSSELDEEDAVVEFSAGRTWQEQQAQSLAWEHEELQHQANAMSSLDPETIFAQRRVQRQEEQDRLEQRGLQLLQQQVQQLALQDGTYDSAITCVERNAVSKNHWHGRHCDVWCRGACVRLWCHFTKKHSSRVLPTMDCQQKSVSLSHT